MLEDIAIQFVGQSEDTQRLINIGLVVLGAVIAAAVTNSKWEITRAPYFVYFFVISFLLTSMDLIWLDTFSALAGGYLWAFWVMSVVAFIASGFFWCQIAMARSRDAYGHGRMAFLAFIPIACFWLLFTPSKNLASGNRPMVIPILRGGLGVFIGFVFVAASVGMQRYVRVETHRMEQRVQTEPNLRQASIDFLIRSKGVPGTLKVMANEAVTPISVDEVTTITKIEAIETELRRTYTVDRGDFSVTDKFRYRSRRGICKSEYFRTLLGAGAMIREVYVNRDGREFGEVVVTQGECERLPAHEPDSHPTKESFDRLVSRSQEPYMELFRIIRENDAALYERVRDELMSSAKAGPQFDQSLARMRTTLETATAARMFKLNDAELAETLDIMVLLLEHLNEVAPKLCVDKLLQRPGDDLRKYMTSELQQVEMRLYRSVFSSKLEGGPAIGSEELESAIMPVFSELLSRYGEDALDIMDGNMVGMEDKKVCSVFIAFLNGIRAMPMPKRAHVYRTLQLTGSAE